jgi:signal transduction histidine kinase
MPHSADLFVYIFLLLFGFLLGAGCVWLPMKRRVKTALMHRANMDIALTAIKKKFDDLTKQHAMDKFLEEEKIARAVGLERKRIAADIHDALGSLLASAQNRLSLIKKDSVDESTYLSVVNIKAAVANISHILRSVVPGIKPLELNFDKLDESIELFLQNHNGQRGIRFVVRQKGTPRKISEALSISIYRIVQELAANAIKYSDCWLMSFTLDWEQSDKLVFEVWDDGQKVITERETSRSVKKRVALMGGQILRPAFDVKGMRFHITFQLPPVLPNQPINVTVAD